MKKWNIAAYLRLSSDDRDKSESNSIGNQRNIIKQYIKTNNLNVNANYYIDDGYSGTTFERPDFKKMIKDIKDNKINCIIVKDLSRLGRNYIEVGKYIDEIFPSYNIRFIAINDNIDSYKDPKSLSSVIVPFKNLMNDEYARDISQKVRCVLDNKKSNGQFIGSSAPYGYLRDPNDKYKFIIDKKAGKVVKKIFSMILSGKSKKEVVEELNKMNISTPSVYKFEEINYNFKYKGKPNIWTSKKLDNILKNRTYTGELIQGKVKKVSHKVHKTMIVAEDDWIVIPNHHKALIEMEEFNKVQEILYERNIRVNSKNNYDIFTGYLRCGECDSNMVMKKGANHIYYYCNSYLKDKKCCVKSIQKEYLEKLVIQLLNNFRSVINEMDEQITNITNLKKVNYDFDILKFKISKVEEDIDKYIKLRNEIKEDLTEKFITEEEYWEYSNDSSKKISKLNKEKDKLNEELEKITKYDMNNLIFLEEIKKIGEIKELNRLVIEELIEDIVIEKDNNVKIIFKCEDKYFEALDFINRQKCDIIASS